MINISRKSLFPHNESVPPQIFHLFAINCTQMCWSTTELRVHTNVGFMASHKKSQFLLLWNITSAMTSKKCHTCCRSLGERVQSSLSLGALGWEKFMKHCLKNWKVVLFCFGFTYLSIQLLLQAGWRQAGRVRAESSF